MKLSENEYEPRENIEKVKKIFFCVFDCLPIATRQAYMKLSENEYEPRENIEFFVCSY